MMNVDGRSVSREMKFHSHHSDPSVLRCVFFVIGDPSIRNCELRFGIM